MRTLFQAHIATLCRRYEETLTTLANDEGLKIEGILIHSGSESCYFADDNHISFRPYPHFSHWVPVPRPEQMLLFQPGKKPTYFQVVSKDFWYEQAVKTEDWWANSFNIVNLDQPFQVFDHLPSTRRIAFLGENTKFAAQLGMMSGLTNHPKLICHLDWNRGAKTEYEIRRVAEANHLALKGHEAARNCFENGGSEWEIHMAFLQACGIIELDSPYGNIVALDEKSAILHYQNKRHGSGAQSKVMLIDAGVRIAGYCSDITRTYTRASAAPEFRQLVHEVDQLQLDLADLVSVDRPYPDLHEAAHERIAEILTNIGVCSVSVDEQIDKGITRLFFPHGIGHLLGLQVHDVAGHMKNEKGEKAPPPKRHPYLRCTRTISEGMVFTIEPGVYFIPVLLDPERNSERGKLLNWSLIDTLIPHGGVRIEDNIVASGKGHRNLTRGPQTA